MQRGRPAITISMPPEPCVSSPDVNVDPARGSFEIFGDQLEERLANKIRVAEEQLLIAGASLGTSSAPLLYGRDFPCGGMEAPDLSLHSCRFDQQDGVVCDDIGDYFRRVKSCEEARPRQGSGYNSKDMHSRSLGRISRLRQRSGYNSKDMHSRSLGLISHPRTRGDVCSRIQHKLGPPRRVVRFFNVENDFHGCKEDLESGCTGTTHPLRILTLHGVSSNAAVSALQLENLRLHGCDFVNAPAPMSVQPDPSVESLVEGPFYSWFDRDDATTLKTQLVHALQGLLEFVTKQGPFEGAYGFSQGAAMLTLLMQDDVRRLISQASSDLKFEFVILGCCSEVGGLRRALGLPEVAPRRVDIPSLHIIGQKDPLRPKAEAVAMDMYSTGEQRMVLYTGGAHEITRDVRVDAEFCARMTWHFSRFSAAFARAAGHGIMGELGTDGGVILCESMGELVRTIDESTLPWTDISEFSSIRLVPSAQLVRCFIREAARERPQTFRDLLAAQPSDKPFLRDAQQPSNFTTYGQLLQFVSPGGLGYLTAQGIRKGEVVVYCTAGGSALGAVALLSFGSQTTCAPLDPNISEKDAAAALAQFEARHVVLFEGVQCAGLAAAARASPGVRVHSAALLGAASPGIFRFTGDCGAIPEADGGPAGLQPCSPIIGFYNRPDDVALLLRTSGTTSMPKVVPLRQGALCVNSLLLGGTLGLTSDDVCLNVMPLFHIGGLSASIIGSMAVGAQVTCMSAFDPAHFFSALSGQAYGGDGNEALGPQPTWYSAVPTIHVAVLNHLQTSANDGTDLGKARSPCRAGFHKLRFIRSGAAALSPQDARNVSDTFGGIPVWSTYSMSEQMPISQPPAFIDPDVHMIEKEGSVGVPVAASLAVVDEKTFVPQPFGRPGVIAISGPTVMQNYLHNPTADASSYFILSCATAGADETSQQLECNSEWRQERFFLTGDVGELDEEGHLVIKGRSKEMIKRGGEQVSPYEVEEVLEAHNLVRKAVVFAVTSTTWGEEVGAAIVVEDNIKIESEHEAIQTLKEHCIAQGLAPFKCPGYFRIVLDQELPKTSTHKYIRSNLAETLGITEEKVATPRLGPPRASRALSGIRFFLACQVMFNHIGASKEGDFGLPGFGVVGSARSFCIHMPAFFALAGFGLAQSMGPAPASKTAFVVARISPMHPMYLLSLFLLLINLLMRCNPKTYDPVFHWEAQPNDASRGDFCEPSALLPSFWGTLASTVVVYSLGLQAWFPLYDMTWFLSYYAWFSSCYYFMLAVYPWLYSKILKWRGCKRKLVLLMLFLITVHYAIVAGFVSGYFSIAGSVDDRSEGFLIANRYCLAYYLSPIGWAPMFALGVVAAFIFDATRPYLYPNSYLWGIICDVITAGLVAQTCITARQPQDMRPSSIASHDALSIRAWAAILSRIYGPLMVLWLFAMAVGKGLTCRFFSNSYFVETLGPISYFTYLFHQVVAEWYWLATRNEWWSWWRHRKDFYWFSPAPCPVAWWEFFFIVTLTVWFSMAVARIDPWLVAQWERARRSLHVMCGGTVPSAESSTLDIVLDTVKGMTGVAVDSESTLAEVGLASIAAPVLISQLSRALPHVTVGVADLVTVNSVGELAAMLEDRRREAMKTGI